MYAYIMYVYVYMYVYAADAEFSPWTNDMFFSKTRYHKLLKEPTNQAMQVHHHCKAASMHMYMHC